MSNVVGVVLFLHVLRIRLVVERLLRDLLIVAEIESSPAINFTSVHPTLVSYHHHALRHHGTTVFQFRQLRYTSRICFYDRADVLIRTSDLGTVDEHDRFWIQFVFTD